MSQLMAMGHGRSLALLATAAATAFSIYLLFKRLCSHRQKKEAILKLIIYPIKSLAGIEVERLQVTRTGMVFGTFHDRSYVLLSDPAKVMITQRAKPKLSLIRTSFNAQADQLILKAPNLETLTINANEGADNQTEVVHFQVWGQDTTGIDCGPTVNAWFSRYLGSPARLVKFIHKENTDGHHRASNVLRNGQIDKDQSIPIQYQDQTPAMLLNDYSVEALNRRLAPDAQITYRNFRPNILVRAGGRAWAEDDWQEFSLGSIRFYKCKPCTRCTFTTVIPEEGRKHPDGEPLKTLRSFRVPPETEHLYGDSPLFGISLATHNEGVLTIDDEIRL